MTNSLFCILGRTRATLLAIGVGLIFAAAACGSSDTEADAALADSGTEGADPAPDATSASEPDSSEAPSGDVTGTVTISDGTVYDLTFTTCDTSNTNPSALPLDDGYDLFARTADGAFEFQMTRAGFDNESVFFAGILEGDFDDEGKNALMLYSISAESLDIAVDGASVSGTFALRAVGPPTRPHGDDAEATVEVSCQ